jgi:GT2 family glycosyltransferase
MTTDCGGAMPDDPTLAVGVVSLDRATLTRRCIESLDDVSDSLHLVVADNGSSEPDALHLLDELERRPNTTVIRLGENLGPAAGKNAILDYLPESTDAVAFADNDIVFLPGWDLAARTALSEGWDVVQPKLLFADGERVHRGPTRPWPEEYLVNPQYVGVGADRNAPEVSERVELETFAGSSVVSLRVFGQVGRYDERIWVGEDYELALRARKQGMRILYEPRCEWIHDHVAMLDYDRVRYDIPRHLESHVVLWHKHRKLFLGPDQIRLYCRLIRSNEPFVLERSLWPRSLFRRLRRKILRALVKRSQWRSAEEGARATARVEQVLRRFGGA